MPEIRKKIRISDLAVDEFVEDVETDVKTGCLVLSEEDIIL